jgi:hypothetical protein
VKAVIGPKIKYMDYFKQNNSLIWNHACSYTASYDSDRLILNYWFCMFIYGRFLSCVCCTDAKGSFSFTNDKWTVLSQKGSMAYFEVLSQYLPGELRNIEKPQVEYPACGPIIEPWASRIRSGSTELLNMTFDDLNRVLFVRGYKLVYSVSKRNRT